MNDKAIPSECTTSRPGELTAPPGIAFADRMESGPWFEAGTAVDGGEVLSTLQARRPRQDPYCVYAHIPFCEHICPFCALYTRAVPSSRSDIFDEYLDALVESLRCHPWRGRSRPPTTVHFGGGTPLQLGMHRFERLVGALRDTFGDSDDCEWALEATTSSIDDDCCARLRALGFTRVHLGIQTLDDPIRRAAGRRESGAAVLAKIERLQRFGFHASVDLILGLGDYREAVLERDLTLLHAAGVRMFSICELRLRKPQQSQHARRHESERNFSYWRLIWSFMRARGLVPIHLGQFAHEQADNLYFTHPARDEDCVAIGSYAHGSAGNLYYQNKLLKPFLAAAGARQPVFDHGVLYDSTLQCFRQLEKELLCQHVNSRSVAAAADPAVGRCFEQWTESGLVDETAEGWRLTCAGSWYVGNMIAALRAVASAAPREMKRLHTRTRVRQYATR